MAADLPLGDGGLAMGAGGGGAGERWLLRGDGAAVCLHYAELCARRHGLLLREARRDWLERAAGQVTIAAGYGRQLRRQVKRG